MQELRGLGFLHADALENALHNDEIDTSNCDLLDHITSGLFHYFDQEAWKEYKEILDEVVQD